MNEPFTHSSRGSQYRVIALIAAFTLLMLPAAWGQSVGASPTGQTVVVGSTVTVNISVQSITNLFGFQMDVGYNPNVLTLVSVSEGTFLNQSGGASTLYVTPNTSTPGIIDNVAATRTSGGGLNGSGQLISIQFTAAGTGSSSITLSGVKLSDPDGQPLLDGADAGSEVDAGFINNGTVTVQAPPPNCPNGVIDSGEQCDGSNLGGASCTSLGFSGGTLSCNSSCQFNTSQCTSQTCGNNVREGNEVCDGSDLAGQSCTTQGFGGGSLACNSTCTGFDTSSCTDTCIDNDGDGYGVTPTTGCAICESVGVPTCLNASFTDCNDNNINVRPGATESSIFACVDTLDNDCDGQIDCNDSLCDGIICNTESCGPPTYNDYCTGNTPFTYSGVLEALYCSATTGTCTGVTCNPTAGAACGTSASCGNGTCLSCAAGRANCDQNPATGAAGCEINLNTNESHCGACGITCNVDEECIAGSCEPVDVCEGFTCGNNSSCVDQGGSPACQCAPGFIDCDGNGANGCEFSGASCPACVNGTVESCTTAGLLCSGTRTCVNGSWTSCTQDAAVCTPGEELGCVPSVNNVSCPALFDAGVQTCNACGQAFSACSISGSITCCPGEERACTSGNCSGIQVCNSSGLWSSCVKNDPLCGVPTSNNTTTGSGGSGGSGGTTTEDPYAVHTDRDGDGVFADEGDCNDFDVFVGSCAGCSECVNHQFCRKMECAPTVCPADECNGDLLVNYPDLITNLCSLGAEGAGSCSSNPCTPTISFSEECAEQNVIVDVPDNPAIEIGEPEVPSLILNSNLVVGVVIVVVASLALLVVSLKMQF